MLRNFAHSTSIPILLIFCVRLCALTLLFVLSNLLFLFLWPPSLFTVLFNSVLITCFSKNDLDCFFLSLAWLLILDQKLFQISSNFVYFTLNQNFHFLLSFLAELNQKSSSSRMNSRTSSCSSNISNSSNSSSSSPPSVNSINGKTDYLEKQNQIIIILIYKKTKKKK